MAEKSRMQVAHVPVKTFFKIIWNVNLFDLLEKIRFCLLTG